MIGIRGAGLSVERLTIPIKDLPQAWQGITMAQLSDLHFDGESLSRQFLQATLDVVNQAQPDLICLTGDYVTDDPEPIHELSQQLQQLQARLGIYASLGNHDIYYPESQGIITQALEEVGIQVLWDKIAYPLGPGLAVVGLRDFWSFQFNPGLLLNDLSPDLPRIVLSHNPDSAKVLKNWRVDLQLSGHTHGGQVVIPQLGPLVAWLKPLRKKLPKLWRPTFSAVTKGSERTVQYWQWAEGLHQVGENWLYVNRGLGSYWPGRWNCPPEVTLITLVAAPQSEPASATIPASIPAIPACV